jgi:hypothetical protein
MFAGMHSRTAAAEESVPVNVWDLTKLLFRRWYLVIPMLMATVGATVAVPVVVKPEYVATAYVQLIPAATVQEGRIAPGPPNPWEALGLGSLSQAAMYRTTDQTFLDRLLRDGYSINFSIVIDYPSPVSTIEVIGSTEEQAVTTMTVVVKQYTDSVKQLQMDHAVRSGDMITTTRLDQGDNIKMRAAKVKRALIAVAGAGLLLSVAFTIGMDALIRRRRRRVNSGKAAVAVDSLRPSPSPNSSTGAEPQLEDDVALTAAIRDNRASATDNSVAVSGLAIEYQPPVAQKLDAAKSAWTGSGHASPAAQDSPDATVVLPTMHLSPWGGENRRKRR